MQLEHDPEADAVYIRLQDKPYAFGEELDHDRRIDYAADHEPIGIELLSVSEGVNVEELPKQKEVVQLLRLHGIPLAMRRSA